MPTKLELKVGQTFDRWTVIDPGARLVYCRCSCGHEKWVEKQHLVEGRSKGCRGCQIKHPYLHLFPKKVAQAVHGAIYRCTNANHRHYDGWGGRGIKVWQAWLEEPAKFCEYLMTLPGWDNLALVIDRIDNDGNYEPGNLRWATRSQSQKNQRKRRSYPPRIGSRWAKAALASERSTLVVEVR